MSATPVCGSYPIIWAYHSLYYYTPMFAYPGYTGNGLFQTRPVPNQCQVSVTQTGHTGGMQVALGDGSVRTVTSGVSPTTWASAITPAGGEVLGFGLVIDIDLRSEDTDDEDVYLFRHGSWRAPWFWFWPWRCAAVAAGPARFPARSPTWGRPLPGGTVTCMTKNNHPFMGKIESDGSYTVNGVPTGPVTVAVEAGVGADEPPLPLPGKDHAAEGAGRPGPKVPTIMQLPRQYANPDSSGLGLTVARGANPFNIDLK